MRRRTRGEAAIEALLHQVEPGSERHRVLVAARDFKASWVELGERLAEVREGQLFRQWGHASFEAYCRTELRIRTDTANKLTRSYAFVRDHQPEALNERNERELPPLDVVDLLSRAKERSKVSDADFFAIREEVFAPEGGASTRGELMKRFREIDPDAFRSAPRATPAVVSSGDSKDIKKALLLAERLQALLEANGDISKSAHANIRSIVVELKKLFSQTQKLSA